MKILYHANCLDGFGAAYAAWTHFGDTAEYIPVSYGREPPFTDEYDDVIILDFSYTREVLLDIYNKVDSLLVIDHHKTAMEDLNNLDFTIFDMGKSGCVLAWEYFNPGIPIPKLLLHIQDMDLWKFDLLHTKEVCESLLNLHQMDFNVWADLYVDDLITEGKAILTAFNTEVKKLLLRKQALFLKGFGGLSCNATPKYASELGNKLAIESGTFGLVYSWDGANEEWQCSLRSVGDTDVSIIAKQFGGGGHKNASGFAVKKLMALYI